jgi:hypothetical protein
MKNAQLSPIKKRSRNIMRKTYTANFDYQQNQQVLRHNDPNPNCNKLVIIRCRIWAAAKPLSSRDEKIAHGFTDITKHKANTMQAKYQQQALANNHWHTKSISAYPS